MSSWLFVEQRRQAVQILGAKHLAESAHGKEELTATSDPPRTVFGQGPGSDQAMQMEVGPQSLVPGVQHERETDLPPNSWRPNSKSVWPPWRQTTA